MRRAGRMAAWVGGGDGRRGRWDVRGSPRDRDGGGVGGSMDGRREPGKGGRRCAEAYFLTSRTSGLFSAAARAACGASMAALGDTLPCPPGKGAYPPIPQSPNPPIPQSPNPPIPQSPNPPIPQSPNPPIPPPNPQIPKSANPQTPNSANPQIPKSANSQTHPPNPPPPQFPYPLDLKPLPFPQIRLRAPRANTPFSSARRPAAPRKRRRQAPARGPAAVNFHHRPIGNETKRPSPLLVGLGRVNTAPTALAGGTAAPCSWGGCVSAWSRSILRLPVPPKRRRRQAPARGPAAVNFHHRPIGNETKRPSPLLVGLGRVNTAPTALAGRTAAPCSWGLGA